MLTKYLNLFEKKILKRNKEKWNTVVILWHLIEGKRKKENNSKDGKIIFMVKTVGKI